MREMPIFQIAARAGTVDRLREMQAERRANPIIPAREFLTALIGTCCPRACAVVPVAGIEIAAEPAFWLANLLATGYFAEPRGLPPYPTVANGALIMLCDELDAAVKSGAVARWIREHPGDFVREFVGEIVEFLRGKLRFK
jgi:hypothetical protein